jgi:hypothetical protein
MPCPPRAPPPLPHLSQMAGGRRRNRSATSASGNKGTCRDSSNLLD